MDAYFHCTAVVDFRADFRYHVRYVSWKDIFYQFTYAASSELYQRVQVEIDIPDQKYQVKSYLSPWFSGAYTVAIAYKTHIFRFCQQNEHFFSKCFN